jgi:DDB1- and CUL4-associated factor 11
VALVGAHRGGVNFIDACGDGRYFLSSAKDQLIKLWDMRWLASNRGATATGASSPRSLMSYRGHSVFSTLIRARFSPAATTGRRFIVSGSEDGWIYVYDLLTGRVRHAIGGHDDVVRDVAWHPHLPMILSASWDGSIGCSEPAPAGTPRATAATRPDADADDAPAPRGNPRLRFRPMMMPGLAQADLEEGDDDDDDGNEDEDEEEEEDALPAPDDEDDEDDEGAWVDMDDDDDDEDEEQAQQQQEREEPEEEAADGL